MLQPGDTLSQGKYRIIRKLGEGSYGIVYLADESGLHRKVALKLVQPELLTGAEMADAFNDEACLAASLDHPYIVPIYSLEQEELGGKLYHYLVMPYMEEGDLRTVLNDGPQDFKQKLRWMRQIAEGIAYAHQHMIIHRDLKPQNIFVRHQDVKIGDFGLARVIGSTIEMSAGLRGTLAYLSPEQSKGGGADFQSDIYALGVTYYQMLTGRLPFDAEEPGAMIEQHIYAPIPSARATNPEVPPALDRLIRRMMAKDPGRRPASAHEVATALRGLQDALQDQGQSEHKRRPQAQRRIKWLALTAVCLLLLGGVFFGIVEHTQQKDEAKRLALEVSEVRDVHTDKSRLQHKIPAEVAQELQEKRPGDAQGIATNNEAGARTGLEAEPKQEIEVVKEVREGPVVTSGHPEPQEMRQWVEDRLRAKGFAPCPNSGIPTQCDVRVTATDNGRVDLLGSDVGRKQEIENVVREISGVAETIWHRPQPQEMRQWVEDRLRAKGFMCPNPSRRLCLKKALVTPEGVVHLDGDLCLIKEEQEARKLSKDILGVTDVRANQAFTRQKYGVGCQN